MGRMSRLFPAVVGLLAISAALATVEGDASQRPMGGIYPERGILSVNRLWKEYIRRQSIPAAAGEIGGAAAPCGSISRHFFAPWPTGPARRRAPTGRPERPCLR
ncbi:exported protein of unknown function [Shinella sp. WSC3-e]|nr:exported protein of unknown function [Shinella sp. WSC3-e]